MKFKEFVIIKDSVKENYQSLNESLSSNMLNECLEYFKSSELTIKDIQTMLSESLAAFVKSPIKAMKIKGAGKKLIQARIDLQLIDFERKEKVSKAQEKLDGDALKKVKDKLKKGYDAKTKAMKDQVDAIEDTIDQLGGKDSTLSSYGANRKLDARIKANQEVIGQVDAEESKSMKDELKAQELRYQNQLDKEKEAADKIPAEDRAIAKAEQELSDAKDMKSNLSDDASDEDKAKADKAVTSAEEALAKAKEAKAKGEKPKGEKPKGEEPKGEEPKGEEPDPEKVKAAEEGVTKAKEAEAALGDDASDEDKTKAKAAVTSAEEALAKAKESKD